jgi:hypothetical protein
LYRNNNIVKPSWVLVLTAEPARSNATLMNSRVHANLASCMDWYLPVRLRCHQKKPVILEADLQSSPVLAMLNPNWQNKDAALINRYHPILKNVTIRKAPNLNNHVFTNTVI